MALRSSGQGGPDGCGKVRRNRPNPKIKVLLTVSFKSALIAAPVQVFQTFREPSCPLIQKCWLAFRSVPATLTCGNPKPSAPRRYGMQLHEGTGL